MKTRSDMVLLMRAMLPPVVWFACFSLLYSVTTLVCGPGLLVGIERYLSLGLAVVVIVGLAVTASIRIDSHPFLTMVSRGLSALAIIAVGWLMLPMLMLNSCEPHKNAATVALSLRNLFSL
jgi:hypothetical protein